MPHATNNQGRQTNKQKKQIDYWPSSRTLSPLPFLVNAGDGGLAGPVVMGLIFPSVCGGDGARVEVGTWSGAGSSMKPRQRRQPSKSIRACMQPHSVTFCWSQGKPTGCAC